MLTMPKTAWVKASNNSTTGLHFVADQRQREAEQDGDQQHLQNISLGESVHHGRRDDVHQEVGHALLFRGSGVIRHGL